MPLSSASIGIPLKRTKMSTDGRQGVVTSIEIFPQMDKFTLKYYIERFDSSGNAFTDVKYNIKTVQFKDIPEIGTVEYTEDGLEEKPNSYVKISDEDLQVTDWYNLIGQVGTNIMGSAILYIETIEAL